MIKDSLLTRVLAMLAALGLALAAYVFIARPPQLTWGATAEEIARPMPGDELDANPTFLATRAITIAARPEAIWPWLIQMGYGRAGFYGFDLLENLGSPRGLASADRILPEFQHFSPGDVVPISPVAEEVFHAIAPGEYMVWAGKTADVPGGFTWALYPIDEGHTRLVSRIRWSHHWTQPGLIGLDIFTEFTDHLAVRKILQGVRDRAEGRREPMAVQTAEFGIYLAALIIFMAGLAWLLFRPLTWAAWLATLAAGAAWLIAWYAPVPAWAGAAVTLAAAWCLWRAQARRAARA